MKKGFIIAGSFLLVCLVVLAIIFGGGNDKKDNPQDLIKEESDTGLEVIDPEQMEDEEKENAFIAPDQGNADKKNEEEKKDEKPQGDDNGENSETPKGDLDDNKEDDEKTQMGEFF